MFEERFNVLCTALLYVALSSIGAKIYHTYAGIVRFSSFIDLLHVAYANVLTLLLVLMARWITECIGVHYFSALNQKQTVIAFVIATLVMSFARVIVKILYDVATADKKALRVLIYGAMTGGIGLAKNIRSQNPQQFILRGFISHDPNVKHIQLLGEKVYNIKDDLSSIIKKE